MCHVKRISHETDYWCGAILLHMEPVHQKKLNNKLIGRYGEDIAVRYLANKGFLVLDRNYLKKWGEIDIVARRTEKVHFIEVKAVSYETKAFLEQSVSRGTWRPEENVHPQKLKRLHRAIESWLMEHDYEGDWQVDVIAVRMVTREKYATIKYIENVF